MVRLRLRRKGRRHYPVYDIIAVDKRKRRDGAYLERLGYFDPNTRPNSIDVNVERAIYWLNVGAQPSNTVKNLLSYEGVLLRRSLEHKGKSEEEIREAVEKQKEVAMARYNRRKELRRQRKLDKIKAKEQAEKEAQEAEAKEKEEAAAEE